MKKYIFLLIIPFVFACGPSESDMLKARVDSLEAQNNMKETALNDFMQTVNAVETNLTSIKEREGIISVTAAEGGDDAQARINEDVNAIYALMKENQNKVAELEKKLKSSKYKNSEYVKTIESLKKRIADQNAEIEQLQKDLAEKNIVIAGLSENINQLNANVDTLKATSSEQKKKIEEQTTAINTAFYVVGTTKELKTNKVIDQSGGFIGMGKTSKISASINTDYFTKIDVTKVSKIPLQAEKVVILSTHPAGSYSFEGAKPIQNLVITDHTKFWSVSKYLVVEIK